MAEVEQPQKTVWTQARKTALPLIAAWVVIIWVVEILDQVALGDALQGNGIQPRNIGQLDGILWSPFLHSDFGHLLSNAAPFAVLGALVAIRGRRHWVGVTLAIIVVGGLLTWIFARSGNHIGSSGVVFGYLGTLLGAAIFERKLASIAVAVVATFFYGTILAGLVPQDGISWEGHLAGLIAGLGTAFITDRIRRANAPEPTPELNEFGIDEFDFGLDSDP